MVTDKVQRTIETGNTRILETATKQAEQLKQLSDILKTGNEKAYETTKQGDIDKIAKLTNIDKIQELIKSDIEQGDAKTIAILEAAKEAMEQGDVKQIAKLLELKEAIQGMEANQIGADLTIGITDQTETLDNTLELMYEAIRQGDMDAYEALIKQADKLRSLLDITQSGDVKTIATLVAAKEAMENADVGKIKELTAIKIWNEKMKLAMADHNVEQIAKLLEIKEAGEMTVTSIGEGFENMFVATQDQTENINKALSAFHSDSISTLNTGFSNMANALRGMASSMSSLNSRVDNLATENRRLAEQNRQRDDEKPKGYATGGMVYDTGMAYLHRGERVLNPYQAMQYDKKGAKEDTDIASPTFNININVEGSGDGQEIAMYVKDEIIYGETGRYIERKYGRYN